MQLDAREKQKAIDKNPDEKLGFTIGLNLGGPIGRIFDPDKSAFSAITHIKFAPNWIFRGEAGLENLSFSAANAIDRNYRYKTTGSFLKAGVLYDFFDVEEPGNNDNILIGLNYGFALQEQRSDHLNIENSYWNDFDGSQGSYILNTHWLEVSFGPRTELLKDFYMSWTLNLRVKMFQDNSEVLQPYSIPGFGKGDNTVNLGFSYVLEYFIPWGRKN